MQTFLIVLVRSFTIPIAILNWGAVIVGGVWLAIAGQWSLLIAGLVIIFGGPWLLGMLLAPGLGIGYVGARIFEKHKIAAYPFFAATGLYNFALLCSWCVGFFYFCELRVHGSYIPYVLWGYALATIPWVSMYADEAKTGEAEGSLGWVAAAEFGSVSIMVSVILGRGFQTLFGMALFFVPIALIGIIATAILTSHSRKDRGAIG